jgi:hypothetical protein
MTVPTALHSEFFRVGPIAEVVGFDSERHKPLYRFRDPFGCKTIIVDVEATRAIRQAEVGATRTMIGRTEERLELCPERIVADSAYGSTEMLGRLVEVRAIEPHIPVFDKSAQTDGTFSRGDFAYDQQGDVYICPAGKVLASTRVFVNDGATLAYRISKYDCDACELKPPAR